MADYFVKNGGDGTAPTTWAGAYGSLSTALAAATGAGDRVIIQYDAVPSGDAELAGDTEYTVAADKVAIIASTNSGTATVTPTAMGTGAWIGNSTVNRYVAIKGQGNASFYVYGVTLRVSGSTADAIGVGGLAPTDGQYSFWENCYFWMANSNSGSYINVALSTNLVNTRATVKDCTFRFGNAAQAIRPGSALEIIGGSVSSAGTAPTTALFTYVTADVGGASVLVNGFDMSHCNTGTIVGTHSSSSYEYRFTNCKMPASWTWLGTQGELLAGAHVWVFNCSGGDSHYEFGYFNGIGEVTVSTGIYATDAAANNKYDGTSRCSWKVVTTANCSYYTPFVTPWFETYCGSTSASISISCQILRDGVNAAFLSSEVWGEWSYQGSAGFTTAVMVNDRLALGESATAATAQPSGIGVASWTGESASATSMVLSPVSQIIPQEIGMLRCRVNVGLASTTVYVDPTVRYA